MTLLLLLSYSLRCVCEASHRALMATEAELRELYKHAGQGHVFAHWDACSSSEREELLAQLRSIDPARVNAAFAALATPQWSCESGDEGSVRPASAHACVADAPPHTRERWQAAGLEAVREGKLALVLLAGGQGTRLGSSLPKGMYDIGLPSKKSLFQLQAERISALRRLAGAAAEMGTPWYVMTSAATRAATEEFFQSHAFFGLAPGDVWFFDQGCLPCLSPKEGHMLMESRCRVATAPDGNGGLYAALQASGALQDMRRRGIESVYVYCVDNALVRVGDPDLVGFCRLRGAAAGAKVIAKAYPEEAVGVFCSTGCVEESRLRVVEYSELPAALAQQRAPSGALAFNAANVALHYFSLPFLEACCADAHGAGVLRHHAALKKVACLGPLDAVAQQPAQPNALKLEAFIFDVYPLAPPGDVALLEGVREEDFAPVKNAPGHAKDSPDTARALVCAQHRRWAVAAGAQVVGDGLLELSPLRSYGGEGLTALEGQVLSTPCAME